MSLLAVQGGATGTGTVTLLAPVTNTDRTITLPDATGTVALQGGAGVGKVLQVVQGTTATQTSTTSNSFQSTGLTASITPSSASNKVLVIATSTFVGSILTDVITAIYRGDTSTGTNVSGSNLSTKYNSQASENASVTNQYLDSPSTTSSQTYTFAFKSSTSGQTATAQSASITAVMILMEIAA
jgi:hypothetical protein